jgi:hypothetical protein
VISVMPTLILVILEIFQVNSDFYFYKSRKVVYSILKFTESVCTIYDTDVDQIYYRFFLQILVCFYHFEYVSSAIRRKLLVHLTISIQLPGTLFNKHCTAIQQNITSKPLIVL